MIQKEKGKDQKRFTTSPNLMHTLFSAHIATFLATVGWLTMYGLSTAVVVAALFIVMHRLRA